MGASAPVKYHYFQRYFTYSMGWKRDSSLFLDPRAAVRPPIQVGRTLSGGEFGWAAHLLKDNAGVLR